MARRRAASGRRYLPFLLLAVVGGLTIGLLLSRPPGPRGPAVPGIPRPEPAPAPVARPRPATPPPARVVIVEDRALEAAIRRRLPDLGEIVAQADVVQSEQAGGVLLRWQTSRIQLRTRRYPDEVLRVLEPEVTRSGGEVFARGTVLALGVTRNGRRLVTVELQLVRPPATARVAVIFDDAGGSLEDIEAIVGLQRPVTIAVLPGLRFSRDVAESARRAGLEVFLHLPLEADDPAHAMGPGGIFEVMSDEEIAATVRAGLASVPGAAGVNNHMGSRGTSDERVMRAVLGVVKSLGLIWVDSVTSPRTVGTRLAAEMGIPSASRQVFLDNEDDPEAIRGQVRRLIRLAQTRGQAVAIGHAHRRTAQVLREMLSEFDSLGIEFVPASALAR